MSRLAHTGSHRQAMRAPIADVVSHLQRLLGQRLTARLAGVSDVKAVGQWARDERRPHPDTEQRLRQAYQVAALLLQDESPDTVRVWFVGLNPDLGDRVPVDVMSEDPAAVMQAARAFLADSYS